MFDDTHGWFDSIVSRIQRELFVAEVIPVEYDAITDLASNWKRNETSFRSMTEKKPNLYLIWMRTVETTEWVPQYLGQRSQKYLLSRLRQHFFECPIRTASKIAFVREGVHSGRQFGITVAGIDPDVLRLSVEAELIKRETKVPGNLPWNEKGRNVLRRKGTKS